MPNPKSVRKYYAVLTILLLLVGVGYAYAKGWLIPHPPPDGGDGDGNAGDLPLTWTKQGQLGLNTGSTSGCVHPDAMFFANGFPAQSTWKFYMIYTPYPSEEQEDIQIVRSADGVAWSSPIYIMDHDNLPDWGNDHMADPDWVYIPEYGKFFLLWSVCPYGQAGRTINIAMAWSSDATTWHFDWNGGADPILLTHKGNPSVVFKDGMFHVVYEPDGGYPQWYESVGYMTFQWDNANSRVTNLNDRGVIWMPASSETKTLNGQQGLTHVAMVYSGGYYYMMGSSYPISGGGQVLHCWKASSPATNVEDYGTLLTTGSGWDSSLIYRSKPLHDCYGNLVVYDGKYWLYYSGYSGGIPHIGLAQASAS